MNTYHTYEHKYRLDNIFRNTIPKKKIEVVEGFEDIVRNYGQLLTDVSLRHSEESINLLTEFCVGGRLRNLSIWHTPINDSGIITRSKAMLGELKSLALRCEISDANLGRLLAMCSQLENLSIEIFPSNTMQPLLNMTSKIVKTMSLNCHGKIDRSDLIQLFTKFPILRLFRFTDQINNSFVNFDIIGQMLPNLEKIFVPSEYIDQVIAMKSIKYLNIDLHIEHLSEVNNYLTKSSGLQYLTVMPESHRDWDNLQGMHFVGLIEAICTCTSLQSLELLEMPKISQNVWKLAESLPLLEHLTFSDTGDCDWLEFIEKATRLKRMWLDIKPDLIDFTEKVRLIVGRREQNHRQLRIHFSRPRGTTLMFFWISRNYT